MIGLGNVDPEGVKKQNVILWMDHRADNWRERINAISGCCFKITLVVRICHLKWWELPKRTWLNGELPQSWSNGDRLNFGSAVFLRSGLCFLLCQYWLVASTTNTQIRSLCLYGVLMSDLFGTKGFSWRRAGMDLLLSRPSDSMI